MSGRGRLGWGMSDWLVGQRLKGSLGLRYAALRAFGAAALGVALARVVPLPPIALAAGVAVGLGLARWTRGLSLYAALAAAAMGWALARAPVPPDPSFYARPWFRGVVVEAPGRSGRMVVKLARPGQGRVVVWLQDSLASPRYGDELLVAASVRRFDYPRNPGLPDRNERLARQGFVGRASVSGRQLWFTGRERGAALMRRVVVPARERLRTRVRQLLPDETGAVLTALLAGERQDVTPETMGMMRDSGLMHVLAVSGLHVGIIAGLVWLLLSLLGVRGWWRLLVGTVAIAGYVVFVGARPSAIRAGIMAVAAALAWTAQRRLEPGATLGVAGLALLFLVPNSLFETGTQLSLAAVAGIVVAATATGGIRAGRLPSPFQRTVPVVLRALIVSAAAFAATAPFLLAVFGQVQLLAIPASPPAILMTSLIVALGGLAVLLAGVWMPLGAVLAETVRLLVLGLTGLAGLIARQDWAVLKPAGAGGWLVPVTALSLFLLLHWRSRRARFAAAGLMLCGIGLSVWSAALRPAADRVWFLDPGEGDAMVFEDRAGRVLLYDTGIDGPGVVRDFLRSRGRDRLAVAVVTHPDLDHYGGLLDLVDRVRIERLVVPTRHGPPDYRQLLDQLEAGGTRLVFAGAGTELEFGGFQFRFVWPDETARRLYAAGLAGANDVSLVAMAEHGGYRMLLAGDLDRPELVVGRGIEAQLLKSPHHGSRAGNEPSLYDEVRPSLVVVMGRYPTPAGLEARLPGAGIGYINTRRDGGVELGLVRDGEREPAVRDYRGRLRVVFPAGN